MSGKNYKIISIFIAIFVGLILSVVIQRVFQLPSYFGVSVFLFLFSTFMTLQGLFTLYWMLYAWRNTERIEKDRSPTQFVKPHFSFTALVPARHEELVIKDTLNAITAINYPYVFKEIIVICTQDDFNTIREVERFISSHQRENIKLVTYTDGPINKPHSLNEGLKYAHNDVVVVFDAEDQPHKDIYNIVNTVMLRENADVVQSGVQLMNFKSSWFSTLNVLEYFFWFKSTLHFFSEKGIVPLGGNTVFFKRSWLKKVRGWDQHCLTEDADIGIRMNIAGAKTHVVYDEKHVTQEETPSSLSHFIKQRTRWNQGYIQIFTKGEWTNLEGITRKILAAYILLLPTIQAILFVLVPVSLILILTSSVPVWIALLSTLPFYLLMLQLITYNIGLYVFVHDYNKKYKIWYAGRVLLTFYFFQLILGYSAFRALVREISGKTNWEKTTHINAHREFSTPAFTQPT